ncbi:hypothetical protein KPL74_16010 [Bacillus sp. NP157]|nr:hypothetical protein KPL74_16010 [Bacillus sp. NP157]
MDMLPPQAPPAHVSTQEAAAVAALRRLTDAQGWLLAQREAMPLPPDTPLAGGEAGYLAAFDASMSAPVSTAPGSAPLPLGEAVARTLANVMSDEATLRGLDRTLDAEAVRAIRAWLAQPSADTGAARASWIHFGATRYAGAIMLEFVAQPGTCWLFMPDAGWESFESRDRLHAVLAARFRERLAQVDTLPGMADEAMRRAVETGTVGTVPASGDVLGTMAADIVRVQRDKAAAAWQHYNAGLLSSRGLADALNAARALQHVLDIDQILARRERLLFAAAQQERMARVPQAVAQAWQDAFQGYRSAMQRAEHAVLEGNEPIPPSLGDYARSQLRSRLRAASLAEEPDDIEVEVRETLPPSSVLAYVMRLAAPTESQHMGLLQAAYGNVQDIVGVRRKDGSPLSGTLSAGAVTAMVRGIDLYEQYPAYLHARTHGGLPYDIARNALRFAAADARTAYYIAGEPPSYIDDREQRGYHMVDAVVASPSPTGRRLVGGHAIVAHQLTYRDAVLADVVVFGVADPRSAPRIVAWTPGAPDGKELREFESRAQMASDFLHAPQFERYLLERLPLDIAVTDGHGAPRFDTSGTRLSSWVFGQGGTQGTRTEEPFGERVVTGDVFTTLGETSTYQLARDARWLTRSTAAADRERAVALARSVLGTLQPAGGVAEELATDIVQAVPRMLGNAWRFYDAVKAGDDTEAFLAFVDGYKAFLAIAPVPRGASPVSQAWVRATRGPSRLVAAGVPLRPADTLFEQRFAARGVRASQASRVEEGIHLIDGKRYIEQGGQFYRVHYDEAIAGWRLLREGALDSTFTGPAIDRLPGGTWGYRQDVGLLGGSGRGRSRGRGRGLRPEIRPAPEAHATVTTTSRQPPGAPPELISVLQDPLSIHPDVTALSSGQLDTLWYELRVRTPDDAEAVLRAMANRDPAAAATISSANRAHWHDSVRVARSRPAIPVSTGAPGLPVDLSVPRMEGMERLRPEQWPAELWYYSDNFDPALPVHPYLDIGQQRLAAQITGVPLITFAPNTPVELAHPAWRGAVARSVQLNHRLTNVRIDMHRLRARLTAAGRPAFDLYRIVGGDGSAMVLRPAVTVLDPLGSRAVPLGPGDFTLNLPTAP